MNVKWDSQPLNSWAELHAQGKFIDLDGHQTHYIEAGNGEPLILIHGFLYDSWMWAANIQALAKHYHVYAVDLWGFGYSTREPLDYGYPLYVRQVLKFMDSLGIRQASLAGQSLGGGTAIKLCSEYPDRVKDMILVDAAGMPNRMPLQGRIMKAMPSLARFIYGLNTDAIRRKGMLDFFIYDPKLLTDEYFSNVTRFHKIKGTLDSMISTLQRDYFFTLHEEIKQLGTLGKNILLVWGKEDRGNPVELGMAMHQLLPGSEFMVMENTRHVPNSEDPRTFNRVALDFLNR